MSVAAAKQRRNSPRAHENTNRLSGDRDPPPVAALSFPERSRTKPPEARRGHRLVTPTDERRKWLQRVLAKRGHVTWTDVLTGAISSTGFVIDAATVVATIMRVEAGSVIGVSGFGVT
jgi:hypothetical protein